MKLFHEQNWQLKNHVIFLDVDGTLVGEGGTQLDEKTKRIIDELKKHNVLVLCSNSPNKNRTQKMAKDLNLLWNRGPHKKPHKEVLSDIELPKNKPYAVIGNLYYTDGRFAKAIGAQFFAVKTLVSPKENRLNKLLYWIDSHFLSRCI